MPLNEKTLLDADLHGLITLLVVHREGSVSRAAVCLGVKQPAISNTLARLRVRFDDELFYRKGAWRSTEKADQLVELLFPVFKRMQEVIRKMESFD